MKRRDLLIAAGAFVCGCATMPARGSLEDAARSGVGRVCDHDLCRYFVRTVGAETGRCSLGLPEDVALPELEVSPSTPLRDEVGALRDEVGALRDEVGALRDEAEALGDDVGALRDEVGALGDEVGAGGSAS